VLRAYLPGGPVDFGWASYGGPLVAGARSRNVHRDLPRRSPEEPKPDRGRDPQATAARGVVGGAVPSVTVEGPAMPLATGGPCGMGWAVGRGVLAGRVGQRKCRQLRDCRCHRRPSVAEGAMCGRQKPRPSGRGLRQQQARSIIQADGRTAINCQRFRQTTE
jgi:hypothetical protein